jgi:hypothetical protein
MWGCKDFHKEMRDIKFVDYDLKLADSSIERLLQLFGISDRQGDKAC